MLRMRKIFATFCLVFFLAFYALLAMVLAVRILPEASGLVQFIYYTVAGLFWVIPAGFIIWVGWRGERAITPCKPEIRRN